MALDMIGLLTIEVGANEMKGPHMLDSPVHHHFNNMQFVIG